MEIRTVRAFGKLSIESSVPLSGGVNETDPTASVTFDKDRHTKNAYRMATFTTSLRFCGIFGSRSAGPRPGCSG